MSDTELAQTLSAHLQADIPVPEFLCSEIENRGSVEPLLPLLSSDEPQAVSYAINLIGVNEQAFDAYFDILLKNKLDEEIRSDIADIFKTVADEVKDRVLQAYKAGIAQEYMLEILSKVTDRDEEVYQLLLTAFLTDTEHAPMHASYLASYGDPRALDVLMKAIADESIGFIEFQEFKYAIEALGGEYNEPRDFSADSDYLAIEAATSGTEDTRSLKN